MSELYLGLMSGTSLDGVDAVLVDWQGGRQHVAGHHYLSFDAPLRAELLALNSSSAHDDDGGEIHRANLAAMRIAQVYAQATLTLLRQTGVTPAGLRALGAHGQTIRHRPQAQVWDGHAMPGYSVQVLNAALLAELTGVAVVADFRSRDLAAGGQGAPLAPAYHQALFAVPGRCIAVLNIGGFSNVTLLDHRSSESPQSGGGATPRVLGWDCGPGNVLMDAWTQAHLGQPLDHEGAWAARGRVNTALLESMLSDSFFGAAPPKSTGRDVFHAEWLNRHLRSMATPPSAVDVQATLCELTALSIAQDIRRHAPEAQELIVCGGGAHNTQLMYRLKAHLPAVLVQSSDSCGLPPTQVEACAFAWLARQHCLHQAGNLPAVTGAAGPRILGALYPA